MYRVCLNLLLPCFALGAACLLDKWRCRALLTFALHSVCVSVCPVLQRDCEVEVQSVDRVGNFQGTVRFGKMNLGGERAHTF